MIFYNVSTLFIERGEGNLDKFLSERTKAELDLFKNAINEEKKETETRTYYNKDACVVYISNLNKLMEHVNKYY